MIEKKELEIAKTKEMNITLKLEREDLLIKNKEKGKFEPATNPQGEIQRVRDDTLGLLGLLSKFNSSQHQLRDCQIWTQLRNKLRKAFYEEEKEIVLTLDQAAFLKDYLKNLQEKDGKGIPLPEFEINTQIGILEQFGAM